MAWGEWDWGAWVTQDLNRIQDSVIFLICTTKHVDVVCELAGTSIDSFLVQVGHFVPLVTGKAVPGDILVIDEKDELIRKVGQAKPRPFIIHLVFQLNRETSLTGINLEHSEVTWARFELEKLIASDLATDPVLIWEVWISSEIKLWYLNCAVVVTASYNLSLQVLSVKRGKVRQGWQHEPHLHSLDSIFVPPSAQALHSKLLDPWQVPHGDCHCPVRLD